MRATDKVAIITGAGQGIGREMAAAALFLASEESAVVVGHLPNVGGGFDSTGLRLDPDRV